MSCSDFTTCAACSGSWSCVWCPATVQSDSRCLVGNMFGQSSCPTTDWRWRQCQLDGWVVLLIASVIILFIIILVVAITVCCCRCRKRRKERQREREDRLVEKYKRVDDKKKTTKTSSSSWFKEKYGKKAVPEKTEKTPLKANDTTTDTNPFSVSDV